MIGLLPMVNKINYVLYFILLFYFSVLSQSDSKMGYLSVESDASLDIYIDTTFIASHSFSYLSLAAGKYTLYAYQSKSLKWNQNGIRKQIEIKAGEVTREGKGGWLIMGIKNDR